MPFAVQIADTAIGTPARPAFSRLSWHEASSTSVQRSEGVFPTDMGTVRREASRFLHQPTVNQSANNLSNGTHPQCIGSRTEYAPFALPHLSETPMPEEANGNQTRQY